MKPNPFTYREIDSTNAEAARQLRKGSLPGGTVITADYQSGGKGQGKNMWVSDPGKNILMSWIVYPAFLSVADQFQLSKAVSLGIIDFLLRHSIPAKIKWPNDILCNGSKICGILIENSIMGDQLRHSIVGIGLNVLQEEFPAFPRRATSMSLEISRLKAKGAFHEEAPLAAGSKVPDGSTGPAKGTFAGSANSALLHTLTALLEARYEELAEGGAARINASYLQYLYRLDETVEFSDGTTRFTGVIRGVDDVGRLRVECGSSVRSYGFHEIRMDY